MPMENLAVSVVVPSCGRTELLKRCLIALTSQSLQPFFYEIIVVDDNPGPVTKSLVNESARTNAIKGLSIIYLPNTGRHGPAAARNCGWRAARASIIAFTDDDTVPARDWLENGLLAFSPEVHALCGQVEMPVPPTPTDYERDASHLQSAEFVTANCFCRKALLELLDGFDERFRMAWREDSDLHFRLLALQANITRAPQAVVLHPIRPAPWGVSFLQQKKIQFDALLYKKHPRMYRWKIRATPRWDYYLTVLALLATLVGVSAGIKVLALAGGVVWLGMTARFCMMRMRGTPRTFSHVTEMIVTSILIPPHAVFWRMVGALRFRVAFL